MAAPSPDQARLEHLGDVVRFSPLSLSPALSPPDHFAFSFRLLCKLPDSFRYSLPALMP